MSAANYSVFVGAGYIITIVVLGAYSLSIVLRQRAAEREISRYETAAGQGGPVAERDRQ